MPLILLIAALLVLKLLEVWKFAELGWGWIIGLMVFAYIWFEFVEKILGLDKKKDHKLDEERRKQRLKNTFEQNKRK